ncbi:MAG: NHLP leader peptide family RiPP precursor [Gemmatimonadaceae bacterium]|nr:NHLP leader peptide family RiPP precursor [Gemmatimonadaceae bacterium]
MNAKTAIKEFQNNPQQAQYATEQMQALLSRSATDSAFRQKLLTNPRAAMEEFTGRTAPNDVNIVFVENTADATIVLPDPVDPSAQLSEAELETVAGGVTPTIVASVILVSAITNSFFQGRNDGQEAH